MSTTDATAAEQQEQKLSVQRAIGVLNAAARANMLDRGVPETDADKIIEAERIVELARQAWAVAQQVGAAQVPMYQQIIDVLAEAEVFLGIGSPPGPASQPAPAAAPPSPAGMAGVFCGAEDPSRDGVTCDLPPNHGGPHQGYGQTWDSFLPPDAPAIPPVPAQPEPDLHREAAEANAMAAQLQQMYGTGTPAEGTPGGDASFTADPPGVPEQPATAPSSAAPTPQAAPDRAATGETWADADGGQWLVLRSDGGPHIEVRSLATNEETIVPAGFLVQRLATAQEESPSQPQPSSVPQPSPSVSSSPDAGTPAESPSPESSSEPSGSGSSQPSSPSSDSTPSSSSGPPTSEPPPATAPAEDTENDPQYVELVDQVESDYAPVAMPVPMDLERPPDGMPDDLTMIGDVDQRRLHSQFNALASRARYLRGLEDAKARACKRLRSSYMKAAMRQARTELGAAATVTEVTQLAEEDEVVKKWTDRMAVHADRAEAYKTFFDIYSEHVTVLSRDWTMRDAEMRGS